LAYSNRKQANKKPVTRSARKKMAAAALSEAHNLSDGYAQQNSTNKKLAIVGLTVLVLSLVIPTVYRSFTEVSVQPGFEFNATVTHLYRDQNGPGSTWFATIIRLNSEEQGEMYAEVDKALYRTLALDEVVQVSYLEGPSTIKLKVLERVSKNDR
jgi:hypothetical protein